jgi:hypothetical protein
MHGAVRRAPLRHAPCTMHICSMHQYNNAMRYAAVEYNGKYFILSTL